MRILKSNALVKIVNDFLVDSSQPSNLSYMWNFGSLLGFSLIIQIITGVTLAMHYNPSVLEAFNSVEHIMRDVNNGWLIRYLHSNTASAFFFLVYLHIGRGLFYGSYKAPRTQVWTIGTFIFILMIVIAFLGYEHSPKWFKNNYKTYTSVTPTIAIKIFNRPGFILKTGINYYSTNTNINKVSILIEEFLSEKGLKPIFVYENLKSTEIKEKIKLETSNLSGIYLVLNNITKDYYIGSASTGKFYTRFYRHLINLTGSKILKLAVRKYGIDNFTFIILELFPEKVNIHNNKKLLDLEDFYLKLLIPNYNILTEAGSSFGYKHTDIDRIKMKSNYSESRRKAIGALNKGKTLSASTKSLMRNSALNRDKITFSEYSLANMKKRSKAVVLYNINTNTVFGIYSSITEAAKIVGCNVKTIIRSLKTDKKILLKRFIVSYK